MGCEEKNPVIGIIMGSESDMPAMEPCMKQARRIWRALRSQGGKRTSQAGRSA